MNKPYTHSLQDDQIICRMYLDGASLFEISNTMKISNSTINRILRKNNISRTRNPYVSHKTDELIREYTNIFVPNQYTPFVPISDYKWCHEKYCSTYFDIIDNHDKAYMLGLFYADGNMKDDYTFSITLQERDVDLLHHIKDILHIDHLLFVPTKNPNWQNGYKLAICCKRMNDALKHHGLFPNKSLKLDFPINFPSQYYNSFLRGYMDGDGHIGVRSKNHISTSFTSTRQFCEKAKLLIETTLDINCSIYKASCKNDITSYVQIGGRRQSIKFLDWIYSEGDLYLQRKYQTYMDIINSEAA